MSLVIEEWMGMRLQTGWPMKEPWKLCKRSHGSTELNFWISRYLVLSASSHIMLHEFMHCEIEQIMNLQYVIFDKKLALWDWAGHEPSICDLWSETCYKWFERLVEYLSICLEKVFWINAWETTYSDFSVFFFISSFLAINL